MVSEIPLNTLEFIKYEKYIYVIKNDQNGFPYKFEWNGLYKEIYKNKGYLAYTFKSNNKYFNTNHWHKLCDWYLNENLIVFKTIPNIFNLCSQKDWNDIYEKYKKEAFPIQQVLDEIVKELQMKLKNNDIKHYGSKIFGEGWGEALIPVKIDGIKHIVTWKNSE